MCHWVCPLCHGKGACDGYGSVVKGQAKTFLCVEDNHIADVEAFRSFINLHVDNTTAVNVLVENADIETHEVTKVSKLMSLANHL
jgi:hypothetical protein